MTAYYMYAKPESGPLTVPCRINGNPATHDFDEAKSAADCYARQTGGRGHYLIITDPGFGEPKITVYDTENPDEFTGNHQPT